MFSLVLLVIVLLLFIIVYLINFNAYWKRRGICQETPLPLFGNYLGIGSSKHFRNINQRLYNHFKINGDHRPFGGVYIFMKRAAMIMDLDLVKRILVKDFANFPDRGMFNNAEEDPLSAHLVTLEGEEWRAMRHKLTPTFTATKMKYMFPTVVSVGERFSQAMAQSMGVTGMVEIKELCTRYTIDVIGNVVFGIESHSLENPQEEFRQKAQSVFKEKRHCAAVEQFMMTNPRLAKKLGLKIFKDDITKYFLDLVKETIDFRLKNNLRRKDFMDLLIKLKAQDEELANTSKGIDLSQGLTLEQMTAQIFSFLVAGYETSSTTMAFCLYELAWHPDVQEKLRKEIFDSLNNNGGILTYESIHAMEYLDQVISETLRLYSVLPYHGRVAKEDYHIANTSYVIEKDTMVLIPIDAIHRDPEYFPNPDEFNPDNFEPSVCSKRHPCTFLPFGDGPRNCIGLRFGKMQTKIGLISLLQRFCFDVCPLTKMPLQIDNASFFLSPKNGITLTLFDLTISR
ncbi:putative cytochrome P450 6a14 [Haematobia irritans]|uniref:putative cytochrome P450 6a14 n=1 Tax=Haematobia irritans TaxID=7368 RepID=UPI003F50CEC4